MKAPSRRRLRVHIPDQHAPILPHRHQLFVVGAVAHLRDRARVAWQTHDALSPTNNTSHIAHAPHTYTQIGQSRTCPHRQAAQGPPVPQFDQLVSATRGQHIVHRVGLSGSVCVCVCVCVCVTSDHAVVVRLDEKSSIITGINVITRSRNS